ncbi:hypothetical protein JW935_21940 [candidate division KSB1 bacterium]|nr:hypothetical protein [candidate division KSB1 bacterium]
MNAWRDVATAGTQCGLPLPAFTVSLFYFEVLRRDRLPANLIQAQRDYFGAHTYQRTDGKEIFTQIGKAESLRGIHRFGIMYCGYSYLERYFFMI